MDNVTGTVTPLSCSSSIVTSMPIATLVTLFLVLLVSAATVTMVVMFLDPDEEEAEESGGSVSLNDREVQKAFKSSEMPRRRPKPVLSVALQRKKCGAAVVDTKSKGRPSNMPWMRQKQRVDSGCRCRGMISEEVLQQEVAERVATMQSSFEAAREESERNHETCHALEANELYRQNPERSKFVS